MKSSLHKTLIAIGGPTGVGKTATAIALAQHYGCQIINADSRQVYHELNIGVNKPGKDQLTQVPHHLIGHVSIEQPYSAGMYERDAMGVIRTLFQKNNKLILVGGTGLYMKAVLQGLDEFPGISDEIKSTVDAFYQTEGLQGLQKQVASVDPEYYKTADQKNPRRLSRALEVYYSTGKPYSEQRNNQIKARDFNPITIFINDERQKVYNQIDHRVDEMIQQGLEQEVRSLIPFRHLKSLETVGYREWWDFFDGAIKKEIVIEKIKQHTRNYAKRQWTWWKPLKWSSFAPNDIHKIIEYIDQAI